MKVVRVIVGTMFIVVSLANLTTAAWGWTSPESCMQSGWCLPTPDVNVWPWVWHAIGGLTGGLFGVGLLRRNMPVELLFCLLSLMGSSAFSFWAVYSASDRAVVVAVGSALVACFCFLKWLHGVSEARHASHQS